MSNSSVPRAWREHEWSTRLKRYSVNIWIMISYSQHTNAATDIPHPDCAVPRARKKAPDNLRSEGYRPNICGMSIWAVSAKRDNRTTSIFVEVPYPNGLVVGSACNQIRHARVEDNVIIALKMAFEDLYWIGRLVRDVKNSDSAIFAPSYKNWCVFWGPYTTVNGGWLTVFSLNGKLSAWRLVHYTDHKNSVLLARHQDMLWIQFVPVTLERRIITFRLRRLNILAFKSVID